MNTLLSKRTSVPLYALAEDVFACRAEQYVFLLDLKRDRYCAVPAQETADLTALVADWPDDPGDGANKTLEGHPAAFAQSLLEKGLLRETHTAEKPRHQAPIAPATIELTVTDLGTQGGIRRLKNVLTVCVLFLLAAIRFRRTPLAKLVYRIRRIRPSGSEEIRTRDLPRARELIATFRKVRPFLFTAHNACLLETYVLLEILFHHGIFPDWVFGIQPTPFMAHCWLQHGNVVLNDTLERIGRLSPIMVV